MDIRCTYQSLLFIFCLFAVSPAVFTGESENAESKVKALIKELESKSPETQVAAADSLGRMGKVALPAIPALLKASVNDKAWVGTAMMGAINELGPDATPILIEILNNGKDGIRARAATVLWIMDASSDEVLSAARKALDDKDPKLRQIAERLVKRIESGRGKTAETETGKVNVDMAVTVSGKNAIPSSTGGGWPQFQGPNRDSLCPETGLLKEWPAGGPQLLWKLEGLGSGMSTISIANGRFFTIGDKKEGQFVLCYELNGRKKLWETRLGDPYKEFGALSTPTVDGKFLYAIGTEGDLVCLAVETGAVSWRKSLTKDFGGKMMSIWKFSESPLIDGNRLICTPGGKDAAMVALDKKSGEVIWKCVMPEMGSKGKEGAGYSSAVVAELEGVRQYVQVIGRGVISVAADTGRFLWGYNKLASEVANITHPIVRGSYVFVTNGYNTGSSLLKISRDWESFKAEEVYSIPASQFQNHHGGVVLVDDKVYGGSGLNRGEPTCLSFASGKIEWKTKPADGGSASVLYADGHVIFRYDRGLILLVEATPKEFRLKGSFIPPLSSGPAWAHPVIHDKKLYLRHDDILLCYNLSEKQ